MVAGVAGVQRGEPNREALVTTRDAMQGRSKMDTRTSATRPLQLSSRLPTMWLIGLLAATASPPALAFDADGFRSGMTREQFAANAALLGLRVLNRPDGKVTAARPSAPLWLGATAGFCGDLLHSYSRSIVSDPDYAATLAKLFHEYGPPRQMSFRGDLTTDINSGGGTMQSYVVSYWYRDNDRVRLKSYFDWRYQQGNLGRFQPATITFETRSPCSAS